MATRRLGAIATSASAPDNGGDHSGGGGGGGGTYVDDVFSTYLYEGNNSDQTIENGIDLAGEGGMVWIKQRDNTSISGGEPSQHLLSDTERGAGNMLASNSTFQNLYIDSNYSFNENGFSVSQRTESDGLNPYEGNAGDVDYASWTFRKAKNFFDVVTYTGDGVTGLEIPHNLGCEPGMIIIKRLDGATDWPVYHKDRKGIDSGCLNLETAFVWGGDAFVLSSSVNDKSFQLNSGAFQNEADGEYVAYLFAHDDSDESMIKCGGYTGTGAAGNQIDLGWEPQWIMIKSASSGDWQTFDSVRGIVTGGDGDAYIRLNDSRAESSGNFISLTSTGFILDSSWSDINANGGTYIYMAIRRPNKPADEFEPEELFAIAEGDGSIDPGYLSGFPVDAVLDTQASGGTHLMLSRMTEKQLLVTSSNAAEVFNDKYTFDYSDGYYGGTSYATVFANMFRRAPGFFDVVAYDGNGVNGRNLPHNLGVEPEMFWIKNRAGGSYQWSVWHKDIASSAPYYEIVLNRADGQYDVNNSNAPFGGVPTSTDLILTSGTASNKVGWNYIAYLFASVPGISKVGSYTGNGTEQDIDCGFMAGTRALLVKRTDDTGDWVWHWPSNSGDKLKYTIRLNTTDKFVSQYAVSSIPAGFKAAGDICNINGAEYIFYAIA